MAPPPSSHPPGRRGGPFHSGRRTKVLLVTLVLGGLGMGERLTRRTSIAAVSVRLLDALLRDGTESGLQAGQVTFLTAEGTVRFHPAVVRGARAEQLDLGLDWATLFRPPHLGRVRLALVAPAAPAAPALPAQAPVPPIQRPMADLPALPGLPAPDGWPDLQAQGPLETRPLEPPPPASQPPAPPAGPAPARRRVEDLMLFTLKLGQRVVAEHFPGYPLGGTSYLLPLGAFCRAVSLGIKVDPDRGQADGFIISENRKFHLDLNRDRVEADGKTFVLDRTRVEWHPEDIYVDDAYLPLWLPLDVTVNPYTAIIQVDPREELPIQGSWRREELLGRARPALDPSGNFPLIRVPYAALDWPFLDQNLNFDFHPGAPAGPPRAGLTGSTFLGGDLAFMSANLFFTSRDGNLFNHPRGRLFRSDPEAELLGPMRARIVEGGDFFVPAPALVGGSPRGRGLHIGNFPDTMLAGVDRTTLQGDLLPGWSVELYQNNMLLDYQTFRGDGQYQFTDVPLLYGVNDFRLAFYGPMGERREEHRRLDISRSQTPEGAFLYNLAGTRPGDGATHYLAETAYGISRNLDVRVAATQLPLSADTSGPAGDSGPVQQYTTASLQGYWPGFSSWLGVARSGSGGTAQSATLSTGWGPASATVQRSFLDGFASPEFAPINGLISGRTRSLLNLTLPRASWMPSALQLSLEDQRDDLAAGGHSVRTTARAAMNAGGHHFAHSFSWNRVDRPGVDQESREGLLMWSRSFQDFSLRSEAGYRLNSPGASLERLTLQADTRFWQPWTITGSVGRELQARDTRYSLNALRQKGLVGMRLFATYSGLGGFAMGVGVHLAVGREPRTGKWVTSSSPMASEGAVSALAFLDSRGTGVRDPAEPAVEDAGLKVDGVRRTPYPVDGVIFQPHLRPDVVTSVSLAESTLEDPMVKPRVPGYRIVPRVGKTVLLDFPLVSTGEITGTTMIQTPGGPEDLSGLKLELFDAEGRLQLQAVSAYDGFFDLADLAPGRYTLRVAPAEAERLGVSLPPTRFFEVSPRGSLFEGVTILVTPHARP